MKRSRRISRIGFAVLIMTAMAFALASVAFAGEGKQPQVKDLGAQEGVELQELAPITDPGVRDVLDHAAKDAAAAPDQAQSSDPKTLKAASNDTLTVYRVNSYDSIVSGDTNALYSSKNSKGYQQASSEWVYLYRGMAYLYGYNSKDYIYFSVDNEYGNTIKEGEMTYAWDNYYIPIFVAESGWYKVYAVAESKSTSSFTSYVRATNAPIFDYRATFLTNNRVYYSGHATKACTITYKYKAVATGAMRVEQGAPAKVTVTNTSGRVLGTTLNGKYNPTFGVVKGQIYMIKITWPNSSGNGYAQGTHRLRVINATWTSVAGRSKYSAKVLPKGAYRKGLVRAGYNDVGWFKFKPHSSSLKITFAAGTNDKLVWRVYCNNQHVRSHTFYQYHSWQSQSFYGPSNATWYVKVERVNSTSSGRYQVRFQ